MREQNLIEIADAGRLDQPLGDRGDGYAGDVHGGAGHLDRERGAAAHFAGIFPRASDESTWVLTSYLVSNAIVLPLSGWFS